MKVRNECLLSCYKCDQDLMELPIWWIITEITENKGRTDMPPVLNVNGIEKGNKRREFELKKLVCKNFRFHLFGT